jgi:hypothetical protein
MTGSAYARFDAGCATEWSGGSVINLGQGAAYGIIDAGQAVGSQRFYKQDRNQFTLGAKVLYYRQF